MPTLIFSDEELICKTQLSVGYIKTSCNRADRLDRINKLIQKYAIDFHYTPKTTLY